MCGKRNLDREAYWRGVIADQRSRGCSIAAFCKERKITTASFYTWRRRLEGEQQGAPPKPAEFVAIEVPSPPARQAQEGFEVLLSNGRCVVVPATFDAQALRQLLRVLEEPAC